MTDDYSGEQSAAGHLTVAPQSKQPYPDDVLAGLYRDAQLVIARYPQARSALLPLLHLIQSVDGYVTGRGITFCAEVLGLSEAEVSGVATFYTQYKRHPNGEYTVGVCTNTLCAIMGGDQIWEAVSDHLGLEHDETTDDGRVTLERVECNAACDFAPVVMVNWEFYDNQTPESTIQLVDDLRSGVPVRPTRGPDRQCGFKEMSRTLAGFPDGLADQGVGAGPASLIGLRVAHEHNWTAPGSNDSSGETVDEGELDHAARDERTVKTEAAGESLADAKATESESADAKPADAKPADGPYTDSAKAGE